MGSVTKQHTHHLVPLLGTITPYLHLYNINNTLVMYEKTRSKHYSCFKNMINEHDQDEDIGKCIQFINKIKEHRHSKIKAKHIDKFKHLYFKRFGCHYNFTRNSQNFNNIDHNCTLSGQVNVLSSGNPLAPATPMTSTPSASMDPVPTAPSQPPSSSSNTCKSDDHTKKWVINLSKTPLTPGQLSLLQKGLNFSTTPKYPPMEAYIKVVEEASSKLPCREADELRSDVSCLLRQHNIQHNHSNLEPIQHRAHIQLKQDTSRVILTADKGVAMVIMDQKDHINKANALLQDTNTYKVLNKDPTKSLKNKLITLLRGIKQTGGLNNTKYKQLYPTSAVPPNSMAFPKFAKLAPPSGP